MKINVIGGSGFIGTRLCRRLNARPELSVEIIDKVLSKSFPDRTAVADVRDLEALRSVVGNGAVIINLAAEHRDDVRPLTLYDEVNVDGARNICKVAREKSVNKIIFTSTVAVYGFAEIGTDESGAISPFNDYGRTKYEAEQVFRAWQAEVPSERTVVIIRPTVVFGEQNRGNVYNLIRQIASGRFVMIGNGRNRKSMAYVENISAFIEFAIGIAPGVHVYNYVDKPDVSMSELVGKINSLFGRSSEIRWKIPFFVGYFIGRLFDVYASMSGKKLSISSIRVKKFCADSVYNTAVETTGFSRPVPLVDALERTVRFEFIESSQSQELFYTE